MFFRGQTIGKYRILSTLGSGGFGTVYLAEDTWIDKKVALKVPHRQNVDFGELLREPRLLASLNHPNIVTILTAEKQENVFFIVMEYVPGETLEAIIARDGALDLARALDYTCQICNAVDHAHSQGVLHRDLRPANVLVTESGMVKVADFGTSRFLEIAGARHDGDRQPALHGARAVPRQGGVRVGHLLARRHDVPDADRRLPYETPSPADLDRLMRGELVAPPRLAEQPDSEGDQRHRHEGDGARRRRALPARRRTARRPAGGAQQVGRPRARGAAGARRRRRGRRPPTGELQEIQARLQAREAPPPRFCWHCRKPLHARTDRCPFCGEAAVVLGSDVPSGPVIPAEITAHEVIHGVSRHRQDLDERVAGGLGGRHDPHRARTSSTTAAASSRARAATSTPKGSACFRLDAHTAPPATTRRRSTGWIPLEPAALNQAVLDTIRANEFKACYIRPLDLPRLRRRSASTRYGCPVDAAILCWEWGAYLGPEALEKGVDVRVSSWTRMAPEHVPDDGQGDGELREQRS